MSWFFKKFSLIKPKFESAGYKESKTGGYALRYLGAILNWTKEIANR